MNANEESRPYHKAANLFPLLDGAEYEGLKADIKANGLLEPIWILADGSIIDGRNRHRACLELGITPDFRTWSGDGSLVGFVVSLNLHRRHLTASQRATVAVEFLPMLEEEARERVKEAANTEWGGNIATPLEQQGKSRDKAAALVGVGGRYVSDAKKLSDDAPELFEQVKAGDMTIPQAKRKAAKDKKQAAPPLLVDGKYRVIYADPPWHYGNSGVIGESDNYGRAERHYPTMTIHELCELPVKGLAEDDAVLFLWVTSPILEECFAVVRAWGFRYKASFVWDKVKHNFGHYNSVRHEFLLICTRGSCTPDSAELVNSVQRIERTPKHSEKPGEFRAIIDRLYPKGSRVELFARNSFDGWDMWGNEND